MLNCTFGLQSMATLALLTGISAASTASPVRADIIRFSELKPQATHLPLPLYQWENAVKQPKAVMLCLHGFPIHGTAFDAYARQLNARGFVVYAPDMRGLGKNYTGATAPRLDYLGKTDDDLMQVATWVRSKHAGLKVFVTGESMGGTFAIRLAALHPKLVDGLILSGPGLELCHHYLRLIPTGLLSIVTLQRSVDFSGEMRDFFSGDPNITAELLTDPLVRHCFTVSELLQNKINARRTCRLLSSVPDNIPVLVLQAEDDGMCNPSGADLLRRKLKTRDLTIRRLTHQGHVLLETKFIKTDTLQSVTDWLQVRAK